MYTVEALEKFRRAMSAADMDLHGQLPETVEQTPIEDAYSRLLWAVDQEWRRLVVLKKLKAKEAKRK